jgi:hypothetical protein
MQELAELAGAGAGGDMQLNRYGDCRRARARCVAAARRRGGW